MSSYPSLWLNTTPEQRREAARKSHETRRKNKEAREQPVMEALSRISELRAQIGELEGRLDGLKRAEAMNCAATRLAGHALLREEQIAAAAQQWEGVPGVYFLLSSGRVVYVGQSVNVYARIGAHKQGGKVFDAFAYVPCPAHMLDKLESLYIHLLQPASNGRHSNGSIQAPLELSQLLAG